MYIKFKIKHLRNVLIRFFTKDKCYVCEECHHIHRRDGKEVRLDSDKKNLILNPIWYGSSKYECYIKQQTKVRNLLRNSILNK